MKQFVRRAPQQRHLKQQQNMRKSFSKAATKARLNLESLEDRRLLAADLVNAASAAADRLLVAYQGQAASAVQLDASKYDSLNSALAAYRADPNVRYAEIDYHVQAAVVTNDARASETWGLNSSSDVDIDAPEAWDVTTGSMKTSVAIIDSGIDYAHEDLYLNIWLNQGEIPTAIKSSLLDIDTDGLITFRDLNDVRNQGAGKITDQNGNSRIDGGDLLKAYRSDGLGGWADSQSNDGDKYVDDLVGWNFDANTNNPFDDNGHGTHVAGTIGALANNSIGVAGLLWNVQLVGLKFLDATGGGYTSSAIAALDYAVSHAIQISNNSWGGGGYSQSLYDAINNAKSKGHIFVAAAGNGGSDGVGDNNNVTPNYPANYELDNIISVAATDRYDALARFSNYGSTTVDVAAPGVSILSTVPGGYDFYSGTSMATPHVAGVTALVLSQNPTWTYSQIVTQVLNGADKVTGLSDKVVTGGRLNANSAVSTSTATAPVTTTPAITGPRVRSAVPLTSTNGGVYGVRLTFNEAITTSSFTTGDITGFTGPSGAISVSKVIAVAGSANKQFDITFSTRTAAGNYTFNVGPNVTDASGYLMDQDQDGVNGESTQDRYAVQFTINPAYNYTSTPYAAIYDGYATPIDIVVDRDITITDLNVKLDIYHTYDADLVMYLVGPDGTAVDLVVFRGGSGDNFRYTTLNDEASTHISAGAAPFNGAYRPEQSLTAFDGKSARGTWTLWVEDWYRGYTGRVNAVTLTFASVSLGSATTTALSSNAVLAEAAPESSISSQPQKAVAPDGAPVRLRAALKREVVDALFAARQQDAEQEVEQLWRRAKTAVKQEAFSWGKAVDEFMAR